MKPEFGPRNVLWEGSGPHLWRWSSCIQNPAMRTRRPLLLKSVWDGVCVRVCYVCIHYMCVFTTGPLGSWLCSVVFLRKLKFTPDALATLAKMVAGSMSSSARALMVTWAPCRHRNGVIAGLIHNVIRPLITEGSLYHYIYIYVYIDGQDNAHQYIYIYIYI